MQFNSRIKMYMKTTFHLFLTVLAAFFSVTATGATASAPEPIETTAPILSHSESFESGQVRVSATVNQFGYVVDAVITESTNPVLNRPTLEAIRRWAFKPAMKNGKAVAATIIQPFNYNEGVIDVAARTPKDRAPKATRRVAPVLPSELQNAKGRVVLEAALSAKGAIETVSVRQSTHPELESSAISALHSWSFKHAIKDGEAVAAKVVVPFHFAGSEDPAAIRESAKAIAAVDRAPRPIRRSEPVLTAELSDASGAVRVLAVIDEHGYVAHTEIIESDNEALSKIAIEAVDSWKFRPALEDGVPVASKIIQPFRFNNGMFLAEREFDKSPKIVSRTAPKLPKSVQGISGRVQVELHLDENGRVAHAGVRSSTHAELETPTIEAAKTWKFKPAYKKGEAVSATVVVPFIYGKG